MYRSFLVRVWREDDAQEATGWQAEVQQIQSGERWTFSSRESLLNFLHRSVRLQDDSSMENPPAE